jgi:hypothetical protein
MAPETAQILTGGIFVSLTLLLSSAAIWFAARPVTMTSLDLLRNGGAMRELSVLVLLMAFAGAAVVELASRRHKKS